MENQRPARVTIDLGFKPVMSLREISEQTGISESNVSHILNNAQKKILQYLKANGITKYDLLGE